MTEQERRFKIEKRTSYEEQIEKNNEKIVIAAIAVGLSGAAVCLTLPSVDLSNFASNEAVVGCVCAVLGGIDLKNLIESICRKVMYQSKIEDINTELEMLEQEESRGMKK